MVVEVNQGGAMVATVVHGVDAMVPVRSLTARERKTVRAEPVAALYEQGRVRHRAAFPALEDQMLAMAVGGYTGPGSPDRVDALVWAITELLLEPLRRGAPRVRGL
jgi:phage terminase large subunit-like protein